MNLTGKFYSLALALLVVLLFTAPAGAQSAPEIFEDTSPGVLLLVSIGQPDVGDIQQPTFLSTGTGFLVESGGNQWIVTNKHVAESAQGQNALGILGFLRNRDGILEARGYPLKLVRKSPTDDLAILAPADLGKIPRKALKLAAKAPKMASRVYALGYPGGRSMIMNMTSGSITALNLRGDDSYIQTDAVVNPGNSGGPLVDSKGNVIGVVYSKIVAEKIEGTAFAVPGERLRDLLKGLASRDLETAEIPHTQNARAYARFCESTWAASLKKAQSEGLEWFEYWTTTWRNDLKDCLSTDPQYFTARYYLVWVNEVVAAYALAAQENEAACKFAGDAGEYWEPIKSHPLAVDTKMGELVAEFGTKCVSGSGGGGGGGGGQQYLFQMGQSFQDEQVFYDWSLPAELIGVIHLKPTEEVPTSTDLDLYVLQGDNILLRAEGNTAEELVINKFQPGNYKVGVVARQTQGQVPFQLFAWTPVDMTQGTGSGGFTISGIRQNDVVAFALVSDAPCQISVSVSGQSLGTMNVQEMATVEFLAPVTEIYEFRVNCSNANAQWGFLYFKKSGD